MRILSLHHLYIVSSLTICSIVLLCSNSIFAYQPHICTGYSYKGDCVGADLSSVPLFQQHLPAPLHNSINLTLPACGSWKRGPSLQNDTTGSVFAVIGDYGLSTARCESEVVALLRKMEAQFGPLDFVFTTGDNNYWDGACDAMDANIGEYFSRYFEHGGACISPQLLSSDVKRMHEQISDAEKELRKIHPAESRKVPANRPKPLNERSMPKDRFFPTLGNHDWDTYKKYGARLPYLQYFDFLTSYEPQEGGGQFYTYRPVPEVQLYSLNSNLGQPDATPEEKQLHAKQISWVQDALQSSDANFKFVYFHHPPYSTAQHDPLADWMEHPYEQWGATAVFNGHQHDYERIEHHDANGQIMTYIINGLGGHPWLYEVHNCRTAAGSKVRYNSAHGLMLGIVSKNATSAEPVVDMCFYSTADGGSVIDHFQLASAKQGSSSKLLDDIVGATEAAAQLT
jgi:Calcineurin-like phosphoesterase